MGLQTRLGSIESKVIEKPSGNPRPAISNDHKDSSKAVSPVQIDYIQEFIDSKTIVKSKNTIRNYKQTLKVFCEFVSKPLNEVSQADIERFLKYKMFEQEPPISRLSGYTYQMQFRGFYKWMVDREYIKKNPCKGIDAIKYTRKEPVFLELNEIESLLKVADVESPRMKMIIPFMFATGVRTGELVKIKKCDINWQSMEIKIIGKGLKERKVTIEPVFMEKLEEYCKGFDDNQRIFDYHTGTVQGDFQEIVKKAGIPHGKHVTPYTMRHSFATHLLRGGANIVIIQQFLGHSSLNTTQIYTHITDKEKREAYLKAHPMSQKKDANSPE